MLGLGLKEAEGLGIIEALGLADGEAEGLGEIDGFAEGLALADAEGLGSILGEGEADGDAEGSSDGSEEGLALADADGISADDVEFWGFEKDLNIKSEKLSSVSSPLPPVISAPEVMLSWVEEEWAFLSTL